MGVSLNYPFIDGFSIINYPATGVPHDYGPPHVFSPGLSLGSGVNLLPGYPRFQKVVASRDLVTDEGDQAGIHRILHKQSLVFSWGQQILENANHLTNPMDFGVLHGITVLPNQTTPRHDIRECIGVMSRCQWFNLRYHLSSARCTLTPFGEVPPIYCQGLVIHGRPIFLHPPSSSPCGAIISAIIVMILVNNQ